MGELPLDSYQQVIARAAEIAGIRVLNFDASNLYSRPTFQHGDYGKVKVKVSSSGRTSGRAWIDDKILGQSNEGLRKQNFSELVARIRAALAGPADSSG